MSVGGGRGRRVLVSSAVIFLFIMKHEGEDSMSLPQGVGSREGLEGNSCLKKKSDRSRPDLKAWPWQ